MFFLPLSKAALAGIAAVTMATTGAAWTVTQHGDNPDKVVRSANGTVDTSLGVVRADGISETTTAKASADGRQGSGDAMVSGSGATGNAGTAKGGTTAGATTSGSPSTDARIGTSSGAGGTGVSLGTGGTGATIGSGGTPSPNSGPGAASDGGGSGGPSVTAPTVPTAPGGVSLYRQGSYSLVVPGTPSVDKKLCLSGEVDRCRTLSVPALQGVNVTVSYSANASASAPTFATFACPGGLGVTLSGITPGTNVTVEARGVAVTRTLGSREVSQSASLCDA